MRFSKIFLAIGAIILFLVCLGYLINSFLPSSYLALKKNNEIAAVVNGEKISVNDVERIYTKFRKHAELSSEKAVLEQESLTRQQILDNLIKELLVLQEAKRQNISVSDKEVENRIRELKEHLPKLYDAVVQKVSLREYKRVLKKRILYQKMKERVIRKTPVETNEAEILAYIEKNKGVLSRNGSGETDFEEVKSVVKETLREHKEKEMFDQWIEKLKDRAEIRVYLEF